MLVCFLFIFFFHQKKEQGCSLIVVPSEFLFDQETNSNFRVRVYFFLLKLMWDRIIRQEKEQVQEWMKKVEEAGGRREGGKKGKGKKKDGK